MEPSCQSPLCEWIIEFRDSTGGLEGIQASFSNAKGHQFDCWSGHLLGLQVQSLVGVRVKGNQPTDFLCLSPSFPLSLQRNTFKKKKRTRVPKKGKSYLRSSTKLLREQMGPPHWLCQNSLRLQGYANIHNFSHTMYCPHHLCNIFL